MITIQNEKQLERAITKARKMRPLVRVTAFRFYVVTNKQTGAQYDVQFEKRGGQRIAWCTCKGGEKGLACFHVAAALGRHLQLAQEQAAMIF